MTMEKILKYKAVLPLKLDISSGFKKNQNKRTRMEGGRESFSLPIVLPRAPLPLGEVP